MNVIVLGGKGSAVTTTSVALAAAWLAVRPSMLIEADPSGGDLAAWFDLPAVPSLLTAATGLRPPVATGIRAHAVALPGGLPVVAAPVRSGEVSSAMADAVRSVIAPLRGANELVAVIDAGRCDGHTLPVVSTHADLVVLVVRQDPRSAPATLARCVHAKHVVGLLGARSVPTVVVVVGRQPYSTDEVAGFLGVEAVGELAEDPQGAAYIGGRPARTRLATRSRLSLSAAVIAARLDERLFSVRSVATPHSMTVPHAPTATVSAGAPLPPPRVWVAP